MQPRAETSSIRFSGPFYGLGQLITEYQANSGAVNTGSSPKVQYDYSEMASGVNHSRPTSMTYPKSRGINFNYGVALTIRSAGSCLLWRDGPVSTDPKDMVERGFRKAVEKKV